MVIPTPHIRAYCLVTMNEGNEIVEIRVRGRLGSTYDTWFGITERVVCSSGETVLRASVRDQAALFGLLRRVRDLGLVIRSFRYIENQDEE